MYLRIDFLIQFGGGVGVGVGATVWPFVKPDHLWIDLIATVLGATNNVSPGE